MQFPDKHCFIAANQDEIRGAFPRSARQIVGEVLAERFLKLNSPEDLLAMPPGRITSGKLAPVVEEIILRDRLTSQTVKASLPETLFQVGSSRLQLIYQVWQGKMIKPEDLKHLKPEEQIDLIQYIVLEVGQTKCGSGLATGKG